MSGTDMDIEAVLKRIEDLENENRALRKEVETLKNNDVEIKSELKTINKFISAMTESQSIDEVMTEIESAAKQLTNSDSMTFYCKDNVNDKLFTESEGRHWHTNDANDVRNAFETQQISNFGNKAIIPLVTGDGTTLGVLKAEKQSGFDTADLYRNFARGSLFAEDVKLGVEKENQHQGRITDELTKMYNRQGMNEYLATTVVPAYNEGKCVSILMGDIDHFKGVNDTYGHDSGDSILKAVSDVFKDMTKDGADSCFRFGGEEMIAIIISDTPAEAIDKAEAIRQCIENKPMPVVLHGEPKNINVTMSIGIHEMKPDVELTKENARTVFDEQFKLADNAVYEAKESGRNRVVCADELTLFTYLVNKAADVFIQSEGIKDRGAISDICTMISDSLMNPTEENITTVVDALRSYGEMDSGISSMADLIADKIERFAEKKNAVQEEPVAEEKTESIAPQKTFTDVLKDIREWTDNVHEQLDIMNREEQNIIPSGDVR